VATEKNTQADDEEEPPGILSDLLAAYGDDDEDDDEGEAQVSAMSHQPLPPQPQEQTKEQGTTATTEPMAEDDASPVEEHPRFSLLRLSLALVVSVLIVSLSHSLLSQRSGIGTGLCAGTASRAGGEANGAARRLASQAAARAQAQPAQRTLSQEAEEVAHAQGTPLSHLMMVQGEALTLKFAIVTIAPLYSCSRAT
jgi:hypothetical protein